MNPTVNVLPELKLIVQIDPIEKIEEVIKIKQETDLNKEFAKKVAHNLFNFMQSFNRVRSFPSKLTLSLERQCWCRWSFGSADKHVG